MFEQMIKPRNMLIGLLYSLGGIALTIIFEFLGRTFSWNIASDSICLAAGLILLLCGWVGGNNISYTYRKENAYYKGKLPLETRERIYLLRARFLDGAIIDLIASLILFSIFQAI